MILLARSPDDTIALGKYIGSCLRKGDVIALQGMLAAGKTTITKGIARGLDISEDITSPTFTLISEYFGKFHLYHMDVYRLDSTEDFLNLGVEELIYGDGVCVIEWSEKVLSELPSASIKISLEAESDGSRRITVENWPYGDFPDEYTCD